MASLTSAVRICYSLGKSGNDTTWCQLFWLVCVLIYVTKIAEIRLHSMWTRTVRQKKGGGILDVESGKGLKPNQSGFGKQIRQVEVKTQSRKITSTFRLPITLHYTTV